MHFDPITLIFWANILSGILAPILIVYLIIVGNNRKIMQDHTLSKFTTLVLIITVLDMVTAAVLLFYGLLFTNRGG